MNRDRAQIAALGGWPQPAPPPPRDPHGIALRDCGPCLSDGPRVIDVLPAGLSVDAHGMMVTRLARGVAKYGNPLRVGYPGAGVEAVQEALDLVAYLLALGDKAPAGALDRAVALANIIVDAAIVADRSAP